ncbi:MAG: lysozyme inhibitor LprI family protein [Paracoccus sp. (in: a-proteobacteria)]|uniref:lysozyme inhibitor LprI family protein n=1 Tax=Paracoccus sp. TaxID=267 RepID=UPI0026E0020F|nr:lysozyme inhibitor LprI family protein [Paracoccus sp. (in: a-proteobacteria)]MDO5621981.1 lysozyme inhibitor LprI family protein [Paracoccus sp. (in: a-proteobacteria)]
MSRSFLTLCAGLMLAAPAAAQDDDDLPAYDDSLIPACLAAATNVGRDACIGITFDPCRGDGPDAVSTVRMVECMGLEITQWQALLEASYQQRLVEAEQADDLDKSLGKGATAASVSEAEALRASQDAWAGYREATCAYIGSRWHGGSGGRVENSGCYLDLTARRALWMDDMTQEATQ